MFDEKGFIEEATRAGLAPDKIKIAVAKAKLKELPQWKKTAGKVLDVTPDLMALLGGTVLGIGGTMVAPGPGTVYGGTVGALGGSGAGEIIKSSGKGLLGIPSEEYSDIEGMENYADIFNPIQRTAGRTLLANFISSIPSLLFPGKTREAYIKKTNKQMTEDEFNKVVKASQERAQGEQGKLKVGEYSKGLGEQLYPKAEVVDEMGRVMPQTNNTTANLNDFYQKLNDFEKQYDVYSRNADPLAKRLDLDLRTQANVSGGGEVKLLNDYMKSLKLIKKVAPWLTGGALVTGAGKSAFSSLKDILSSSQ